VGAEDQPRLGVGVVARLPPEAKHVRRPRTLLAEAVVEVGGEHRPVAARPLGHVAALVEGVEGRAAGGGVARHQASRAEHGLGDDAAAGVEFADGQAAVVQVVRPRSGVVLLPPPQAVPAIGTGPGVLHEIGMTANFHSSKSARSKSPTST